MRGEVSIAFLLSVSTHQPIIHACIWPYRSSHGENPLHCKGLQSHRGDKTAIELFLSQLARWRKAASAFPVYRPAVRCAVRTAANSPAVGAPESARSEGT